MIIINADDWGRTCVETDAAMKCWHERRITSVSAMVFMTDSVRAAELAKEHQVSVGLHLNFDESFTDVGHAGAVAEAHEAVVEYLRGNKYAQLVFNPFLFREFALACEAQLEEFTRLYGRLPTHVDGHHHMHLCANMLVGGIVPAGMKMRRNFSFWPGEKSLPNRIYRGVVDRWLARRYRLADFFFCILQASRAGRMDRVVRLAKSARVELMTHPVVADETNYLLSEEFGRLLRGLHMGSYADL